VIGFIKYPPSSRRYKGIKDFCTNAHTEQLDGLMPPAAEAYSNRRSQDFCCGAALYCCLKYWRPFL